MGNLIPVEFSQLGIVEFAWLVLAFGGLSLLAPKSPRVRGTVWVAVVVLVLGLLRFLSLGDGHSAWNLWVGPLVVLPALGAALVRLGRWRLPSSGAAMAWLGVLVLLTVAGRPFSFGVVDWAFIAALAGAVAAIAQGDGPIRSTLSRTIAGPISGWRLLALGAFALCAFVHPFGLQWVGGLAVLFVGWLTYAVISQGKEMRRYVLRRLAGAPVVLTILLALAFFMMRTAPGGPFDKDKALEPAIKEAIEKKYGLDKPVVIQFQLYMVGLIWDGDLGPSLKHKDRSVNEVIKYHAPKSARLGLAAVFLAVLVGVTAGLVSGIKQNSIFDYASMSVAMLGLALPTFIVGPMLVLVFSMKLDWFSVTGWENFPRDLILPAITLALPFMARVARLTRAGMLEIVNQDYIRTARAKGLSESKIVLRHTLKGTLLPVVSFLGPGVAQLLTGSLVVEKIFGVPGMGAEFVESALARDYGVAMGLVLVFGTLLVVFNLIVDIVYAYLDPRIRHG